MVDGSSLENYHTFFSIVGSNPTSVINLLYIDMKKLNLLINFIELKYRILYSLLNIFLSFIIFFEYKVELFFLISESFLSLQKQFIYTSLLDPLFFYIKITLLATLFIFFPIGIYFFSFFFIKSIYNVYIKIYTVSFFILFSINFFLYFFFFNFLLKFFFNFLLTFQRKKEIILLQLHFEATIQQYFSFFFSLIFICILLIFLPILFFSLTYFTYIKNIFLKKLSFRKYIFIFISSFFLLIAPPDFIIQIIILPLIFFVIELYIYLFFFFYFIICI